MSTAQTEKKDEKKHTTPPPANGKSTSTAAKTDKKPPTPKDVFVIFGTPGQQTMKHFKQVEKRDADGNPVKNEKNEVQYVSAKKQAEDFVNSSDAPEGPITIIVGNAKRTKQRL